MCPTFQQIFLKKSGFSPCGINKLVLCMVLEVLCSGCFSLPSPCSVFVLGGTIWHLQIAERAFILVIIMF